MCKLLLHADCGLMQAQMLKDGKMACGPPAGPKPEAPTKSSGAADSKAGSNVAAVHGMFDLDMLTAARQSLTPLSHKPVYLLQSLLRFIANL